jgi:hypothetical protein
VKDELEAILARQVCPGRVPLAEAQQAIATDWTAAVAGRWMADEEAGIRQCPGSETGRRGSRGQLSCKIVCIRTYKSPVIIGLFAMLTGTFEIRCQTSAVAVSKCSTGIASTLADGRIADIANAEAIACG